MSTEHAGTAPHGRGGRALLVVAALVLIAGIIAAGTLWRGWASAPTGLLVDSVGRFRDDVGALPGVAGVDEAEVRAGDLGAGANAFVPIRTDLALGTPELDDLARAISDRSSLGQTRTRLLPVLITGGASVALAPEASLDTARLAVAQAALALDGVVAVSVLWPDQGDDLVVDESNERLDVTVQTRSGSPADLTDTVGPLVQSLLPDATTTSIVLTDPEAAPREHLYSWFERGEGTDSERALAGDAPVAGPLRTFVGALDADPDVLGYQLGPIAAHLFVALGTSAPALAERLTLPVGMTELTIETVDEGRTLPPLRWSVDPSSGAIEASR